MRNAAWYQLFCLADKDFYEPVESCDDAGTRFTEASRRCPPGWSQVEEGIWIGLAVVGKRLPGQGWKVHVSAGIDNAVRVLSVVWDFCVHREIAFKFVRSRTLLLVANSKNADRSSSGKFCTLYPVDEVELKVVLDELGSALTGERGPHVLSDLRYGPGPLSVRYGGFAARWCVDETGEQVPAIIGADGRLCPDRRQPVFRVPDGVEIPGVLAEAVAARDTGVPDGFAYGIERALQFSNAGGVYAATDMRTGQKVVLKEARPLAGWDSDDADAVTRLSTEAQVLRQLAGLKVVPAFHEHLTCWEHHFLAEEHIDATPLPVALVARHPLSLPDPEPDEIRAFTSWVLEVSERIADAVGQIHRRGVAINDLHPSNVLLHDDGQIVLVDFELAAPADQSRRRGLAAPGFAGPTSCTGIEADRLAVACLVLWMLAPTAPMIVAREPDKIELIVGELTDRFGIDPTTATGFTEQWRRAYAHGPTPKCAPHRRSPQPTDVRRDWEQLQQAITAAITATATPQRTDRLFPGDPAQFRYGGHTLAYGAAGVLYALHRTGHAIDPGHVEWLLTTARRAPRPYPGLYNGLAGTAYVLDLLGHRDQALTVLDRARQLGRTVRTLGLFSGTSGIALVLLHFAHRTGDRSLLAEAIDIAERLTDVLRDGTAVPDQPDAAGLMHGFTGPALLNIQLHRHTGDTGYLDLAATALHRELDYCQPGLRDTLQVHQPHRLLPYLAIGTTGIGLVARQYLHHRDDDQLRHAERSITNTCRAESGSFPGLFNGHAGLLTYLATGPTHPDTTAGIDRHLRRISWSAEHRENGPAFLGDQLRRLSTDLATGAAGILLALHTIHHPHAPVLPFLGSPGAPNRPGTAPCTAERR